MTKKFLPLVAGLSLVSLLTSAAPSGVEKRTYLFKEAGKEMEYALFKPSGYTKTKKWPLMVALHGLGSNPQQIMGYPGLTKLAEKHGYVVVAPMGYNKRGWYGVLETGTDWRSGERTKPKSRGEFSEKDVLNVLAITRKELSIDDKRIYLMGHSMGGGGTWHLGISYPDIWAALGPIAPAIYRSPDALKAITHIPVIVVQGDKDRLVPVTIARKWVAKMKELGMEHVYVEVPGGDHLRPAFTKLPDIFEFFNKHKKKARKKDAGKEAAAKAKKKAA